MKKSLIIFFILLLAAFLRLYRIMEDPPALYWDEVAIGYNAYSINQTGKDEWGISWPVLFRSYDDYKPPVYIYTVALFQKFLGPTDFSVRLPSALAGILTVAFLYFLVYELTKRFSVSAISSLMLAISMWHIQFSRAGFEANLALMFVVLGIWMFLLSLRVNIKLLFLSFISFGLSTATYHNAKIFVPVFLIILIVLFYDRIKKNLKVVALIGLISFIFYMPFLPAYFSREGQLRATAESILNQKGNLILNFQQNFLVNFSFDYLFFHGDQAGRHSVKKLGELYVWQLPFILIGLYDLIKHRSKLSVIIFAWLILGAIPAAVTKVSPHALRALLSVVPWQILTAIGLVKIPKLIPLTIPMAVFSLLLYLHLYYIHYPVAYAADWQDGYAQTISYLKSEEKNYDEIYIHDSLPEEYLKWYTLAKSDKFYRQDLLTLPIKKYPGKKSLIVAPPYMVSKDIKVIKEIKMYGGDPVFKLYEF